VKNLETNKEKLFNEEEYRETFNIPKDSGFVVLGEFGFAEVNKYTKLENNKPVYSLDINLYEDQFKGKGLGKDIYLKALEEIEKLGGVLTPGNVVEGNKIWESFKRDGLLSEEKTKEGEIIKEYSSLQEAAIDTNCRRGQISNVCRGRTKSACGLIWKYKN
jgi:predicted GNAT family acetyltransferase